VQTFQLTPEAIFYRQLAFTPDGKWLALSGEILTLLDTSGGQRPKELPFSDYRCNFAFIRGGETIVSLSHDSQLMECDLATGKQRTQAIEKGFARALVSDREGETLYLCVAGTTGNGSSMIRRVPVSNLSSWKAFGTVVDYLCTPVISADGSHLVAGGRDGIRIWDVADGNLPRRAKVKVQSKCAVDDCALTHDGRLLAVADRYALSLWSTVNGKRVVHSGQHRRAVAVVACSPTQPLIVTGDAAGKVFLWDTTGKVLKRYVWGLKDVLAITFDFDGLRAAAADSTGKVVVWDVDV
jgi:WD40 repeat protein